MVHIQQSALPSGSVAKRGQSRNNPNPQNDPIFQGPRRECNWRRKQGEVQGGKVLFVLGGQLFGYRRRAGTSMEHREGYSAEVFFPYQIVDGSVLYGETIAQHGKLDIFESVC